MSSITVGDKVYRSVLDDRVTDKDIAKARLELNETPETREKALRTFKEMVAKEKDMNPRMDEKFLLRFLRVRKYNCSRALKTMKEYYKSRVKYPYLYSLPSKHEKALRASFFTYLPYLDAEGRLIINIRSSEWDPEEIPYKEFMAGIHLAVEGILDNPVIHINGIVGIIDFKKFGLAHLRQFFPFKRMVMIADMLQGIFPARFKVLFAVNPPPLAYTLHRIIKPLLKEKFRDRIKILCTMEELYEYLDREILPPEYGGYLPACTTDELVERTLSKEDEIRYDRRFGYSCKEEKNAQH